MAGVKGRSGRRAGAKVGPTPGSVTWLLLRLKPGERIFFEAKVGQGGRKMRGIAATIFRNNLKGKIKQSLLLAVDPNTREVVELVVCTRQEDKE